MMGGKCNREGEGKHETKEREQIGSEVKREGRQGRKVDMMGGECNREGEGKHEAKKENIIMRA